MTPRSLHHSVPSWALVSALKYAFGRSVFIVERTSLLIEREWHTFHAVDQMIMLKELHHQVVCDSGRAHSDWTPLYDFCVANAPRGWRKPE